MPQQALHPDVSAGIRPSALRLTELLCDGYLALMFSVFLLYFDQNGFGKITAAKRECLYFLTGLFVEALLLYTLALVCRRDTREELIAHLKSRLQKPNLVFFGLLLYFEFTLASALLSEYPESVWIGASRSEGALTIFAYIAITIGLLLFAKPKKELAYVLGFSVVLITVISVLQILGGNPLGIYPKNVSYASTSKRGEPFLGTIGNIDLLVQLPCLAIPIFLVLLARGKGRLRFLLLLPLWCALFLVVQASVLSAFVGLGVGLLLALPFVLRASRGKTVLYFCLLGALAIGGLIFLYFHEAESGMLYELHEILHGRIEDSFGTSRVYIWRLVMGKVPEKLWFGYGPDTMGMQGWAFRRFDREAIKLITAPITVAHNEYMNILFHQGLPALLAYLTALGTALFHFFRYAKRSTGVAIFGAAVLCYAIEAFFNISQPFVTPLFWACLGMLEVCVLQCKKQS